MLDGKDRNKVFIGGARPMVQPYIQEIMTDWLVTKTMKIILYLVSTNEEKNT